MTNLMTMIPAAITKGENCRRKTCRLAGHRHPCNNLHKCARLTPNARLVGLTRKLNFLATRFWIEEFFC
ncbi:Uncharacterised protein r2_g741 [Pycnogonum litorale]